MTQAVPEASRQTLRVMLAAMRCEKGDWEANLEAHRRVLVSASESGCQIAAFPEMSLSGSVDPATYPEWTLGLDSGPVRELAAMTQRFSVAAVFGVAERAGAGGAQDADGDRYFITQVYANQGRIAGVYRKRRLGDGEDSFCVGDESATFRFGSLRFGIALCAEGDVDFPFEEQAADGARVSLLCSAPGLYGRRTDIDSWRAGYEWWLEKGLGGARRHASRTGMWIALATQAGSTADEDFPGIAALVSPSGDVAEMTADWREGVVLADVPVRFDVTPPRLASRVLVLDGEDRVLLVQFSDDAGYEWWAAPGGGLEDGEDHLAGARRELAEELGRRDIEIGPQIGWRSHTLSFNGRPWITQYENWYVARCEHFEVAEEKLAYLRDESVTDVRWWSADELDAADVVTSPRGLSQIVEALSGGSVTQPSTNLGL